MYSDCGFLLFRAGESWCLLGFEIHRPGRSRSRGEREAGSGRLLTAPLLFSFWLLRASAAERGRLSSCGMQLLNVVTSLIAEHKLQ